MGDTPVYCTHCKHFRISIEEVPCCSYEKDCDITDCDDNKPFKKCKGKYGKLNCYYLCVCRGCKMIFVSSEVLDIINWDDNDERIHNNPNCKYRDNRTYYDNSLARVFI